MASKEQDFLKILGERIRGFRMGKKMTQAQLADKAGLHTVSLSAIERGVANTSILTLREIARSLEISLSELIMINEEGVSGTPWSNEAEFAEVLMKCRALNDKERRVFLDTVKAMVDSLGAK